MLLTDRKKEIIDAAIRLIAAKGIQELTMKKIAVEIGVSEPALYRHFSGKSEIIRTLIEQFDRNVSIGNAGACGFAPVKDFVLSRMEQVLENPALAKVMFTEEFFINDPVFSEQLMLMMHRHKAFIGSCIAKGINSGALRSDIAPEMVFRLIIGPVRLLIKQWGMSGMRFDLRSKMIELLDTLELLLVKENEK